MNHELSKKLTELRYSCQQNYTNIPSFRLREALEIIDLLEKENQELLKGMKYWQKACGRNIDK